ncbi:putative germin, rmlC-like cupin domain-containing protein [Medicago truncatula]|uniref:Germin-like protein n=1 Tax=Medicago truncatula TaxID=3880 RepID=G7ITU8_MEDTR|nr:germin-like protein 9-3 [Medicago truncatula]AES67087.1 germin-like protein 9-2 [Medicago truncatula]RHN75468.1 putative germin, rmlC-like cupin domain-containing protein [Medicago truncatula]
MSSSTASKLLTLIISAFAIVQITLAGDPDILTDFIAPNGTQVDGNFFTYTGFRALTVPNIQPSFFVALKASKKEFPALDGQSVSYAALMYPPGTINPPHTHPRSAELLFLVKGSLNVGFVDTTNKLYTQTLQPGDMFVFPKGLVHFQFNSNTTKSALAFSAFGSANAGTISIASTLFNSTIDDNVLALAFKTDVATVQTLKKGFSS